MSYSSSEVRSDSLMLSSKDADWSRPGIIDDHAYFDDPGRPSFSDRSLCVVEKPNWSILAIAAERRAFRDFRKGNRECKVYLQHNVFRKKIS